MTKLLVRLFLRGAWDKGEAVVRERYGVMSSCVGILCNLLLFGLKIILGFLSRSIAVTADAFNNLSDVGSSLVTLVGFKMAAKPADREHPYGHGRIEYLSGLAVACLILLVGLEIGKGSLEKVLRPEPLGFSWVVVAGLAASVFVKLWMSLFNRRLGRQIGSAAMRAASVDSLSDAVSTTATLIAVIASPFTSLPVDGVMGMAVAVMILIAGVKVARETLNPLLGQKPDAQLVQRIEQMLLSYEGILGIHDLIVHDYGPNRRFASAHAEVPLHSDILLSHDILDKAEREVAQKLQIELVLHLDPIETDCEKTNELRAFVLDLVRQIDPGMSIHDFRAVYGGEVTNFLFDICAPMECKLSDEAICGQIEEKLKAVNPNYYAVVKVDRCFS